MNAERIVCEVCGAVVESSKYDRHIKYGHKDKPDNRCHLCQKTFTSSYNLQYHLAHHINARNFICNECPQAYNTAADLAQHQRIHEKQRDPYKCPDCGLLFQIRSRYNTHMRTHTANVPNECTICNKKFSCSSSFASHNRVVHLGLRQHECNECGKTFGKKSGLDRHKITVHEKIRAYKCDFDGCGGAFGEKSRLKKHMMTHMTKDKFYCSLCRKNFDDVKSHYDEVHPDVKNQCNECFKKFAKVSSLKHHIKVFHTANKRRFFCDFCPITKGFAEKSHLSRHMRRHQVSKTVKDNIDDFCDDNRWDSDSSRSTHVQPEQMFVDVRQDFDTNSMSQAAVEKVLITIKEEVLSDDEAARDAIFEPEVLVKIEPEDCEINDKKLSVQIVEENQEDILEIGPRVDKPHCAICKQDFRSKRLLNSHLEDVHEKGSKLAKNLKATTDETKFSCSQCGRIFRYKSALGRHIKVVHENQRDHCCSQCGKSFGSKYDLSKHYESNHDDSRKAQQTCQFCEKTFSKEQYLQTHILAIHSEKAFECEVCAKKFSFKRAKERHVKVVHLNQREHQCCHCQKKFGTKTDLKNHIAYHHSTDPDEIGKHYCDLCDKSFVSSSNLRQHQKGVHQNIKQPKPRFFRCKFCKENLANKYQKEKHVAQVHQDGLKPMRSCQLCNLDFQLFVEFKQHIEAHQDSFVCIICGLNNLDEAALKTHMEGHKHVETDFRRFGCDFCGSKFFNKKPLKVHMRKHMKETNFYVCDICGQSYKYMAPFLYHKKVHEGKKDFVCTYCGKEFMRKHDLVIHTRSHTQEKPFKCTVCERTFTSRPILVAHLQTHSSTRKIFSCVACNLTFVDRNQASQHDEIFHPELRPFWCNLCKKSFKLEHMMRIHMQHKHKPDAGVKLEEPQDTANPNEFLFNLWNH